MPYFGFLTQSSRSASAGRSMSAAAQVPLAAKSMNGSKDVSHYDSEVNEWSELLTNEQEVAVHPVDLPPMGTFVGNTSAFVHSPPETNMWRLPPKQQQTNGGTTNNNNRFHSAPVPSPPPREWMEMRPPAESPPKPKAEIPNGAASNVSARISETRPPPPPPPPTHTPQIPPKKQPPNSCPAKSAPAPPIPNSQNSRGELLRNKVQSDLGASHRGQNDQNGSRTSSPSVTDRLAASLPSTNRRPQTSPSGSRPEADKPVLEKRQNSTSPPARSADDIPPSEPKGPAPQPPTQLRDQQAQNNPTVTRQPQRSMSVSRGLQVEEDDLIQFSEGQSDGSQKFAKTRRNSEDLDELPEREEEEEMDEDNESARTADEQIDYLEGLEPCPCYAKCCLDSIITLFCVTLLG